MTLSVKSFHVPPTPANDRLPTKLAFGADLAGNARHFAREGVQLVHHRVDGVLQLENFAPNVHSDLFRKVAASNRRRHLGDISHLRGEVARHRVDAVGEILPGSGDAEHVSLPAEPSFGADLARNTRHFAREGVELVHHRIDGLFQLKNFAGYVDGDLLGQVAAGDRSGNVGDVANLGREVRGHEVDAVGEVFPSARDARNLGLAAELALRADLTRNACHFRCERVELIDHRVDGVFEFEDFTAYIDSNLAGQIAARYGGCHLCDVADLCREVAAHGVDRVGQVLPRSGDARNDGLAAELAVGTDLTRHARYFGSKRAKLINHGVDRFLQLENLAADIDGDFL